MIPQRAIDNDNDNIPVLIILVLNCNDINGPVNENLITPIKYVNKESDIPALKFFGVYFD